jgi:8-oxo-dGTP pyrophosphatase MutT (NUDIX family)
MMSPMDAIEILLEEHKLHRQLLTEIDANRKLFANFRYEFVHHVNMEEEIFYPNLLKVPSLESIVREAWEEHSLCMQLLQEMDQLPEDDKNWESKFAVLKKLVLQHLDDEEAHLFPNVLKLASSEFLHDVGEQMVIHKALTSTEEILYPKIPGSHKLSS